MTSESEAKVAAAMLAAKEAVWKRWRDAEEVPHRDLHVARSASAEGIARLAVELDLSESHTQRFVIGVQQDQMHWTSRFPETQLGSLFVELRAAVDGYSESDSSRDQIRDARKALAERLHELVRFLDVMRRLVTQPLRVEEAEAPEGWAKSLGCSTRFGSSRNPEIASRDGSIISDRFQL